MESFGDVHREKRPPPQIPNSSFLSFFFFTWMVDLVRVGNTKSLEDQDMPRLEEKDSSLFLLKNVEQEWQKEVNNASKEKRKPSLFLTLFRPHFYTCFLNIVLLVIAGVGKCFQAYAMGDLITLLGEETTDLSDIEREIHTKKCYWTAGQVFLAEVVIFFCVHHSYFRNWRLGMHLRSSAIALIYHRLLTVPADVLNNVVAKDGKKKKQKKNKETKNINQSQQTSDAKKDDNPLSSGQIINLISSDVERFQLCGVFALYIFVVPFETAAILYFGYLRIGPLFFLGFISICSLFPLQYYGIKLGMQARSKAAKQTDVRLKLTNEAIQGARLVKLSCWENYFMDKIIHLRSLEIRWIKRANAIKASNEGITYVIEIIVACIIFVIHILRGNQITTSQVFSVLVLLNIIRLDIFKFTFYTFAFSTEAIVACKRIEKFLLLPSIGSNNRNSILHQNDNESNERKNENIPTRNDSIDTNGIELIKGHMIDEENRGLIIVKNLNASWTRASDGKKNNSEENFTSIINDKDLPETQEAGSKVGSNYVNISSGADSFEGFSPRKTDHNDANTNLSLVLDDISFTCIPGSLTVVIGSVGSSKSSLLSALLGEMPVIFTKNRFHLEQKKDEDHKLNFSFENYPIYINNSSSIAYSPQEPWIMSASVRDNIIFGSDFNPEKYNECISKCNLEKDFKSFLDGDRTIVGDRGVNLSGGQKARIGLARALYRDTDILLLDDPLSAVDPAVGRHLFYRAIGDTCITKKKTIILVTHQIQFLDAPFVDQILLMEDGKILSSGRYSDLSQSNPEAISLNHSPRVTNKIENDYHVFENEETSTKLTTDEESELDLNTLAMPAIKPLLKERNSSMLSITKDSSFVNHSVVNLNTKLFRLPSWIRDNEKYPPEEEKKIGQSENGNSNKLPSLKDNHESNENKSSLVADEKKLQGNILVETFYYYLQALGGKSIVFALVIALLIGEAFLLGTNLYLGRLTSYSAEKQQDFDVLIWYIVLAVSAIVTSILRSNFSFYSMTMGSFRIHNNMIRSVLRAPVLFFDSNPIGRILNRFSKDVGGTDELFPTSVFDMLTIMCTSLGIVLVVSFINWYLFLIYLPLTFILIRIRKRFLTCVQEVRRLEANSRSPIYALFSESMSALPILRCFQVTDLFEKEFLERLDSYGRSFFQFVALSRWLGFRVDFLCVIVLGCACFLFVLLKQTESSDNVFSIAIPNWLIGVSLMYLITFNRSFQWLIRLTADVYSQFIGIERMHD